VAVQSLPEQPTMLPKAPFTLGPEDETSILTTIPGLARRGK
jgi:hypothetical protein